MWGLFIGAPREAAGGRRSKWLMIWFAIVALAGNCFMQTATADPAPLPNDTNIKLAAVTPPKSTSTNSGAATPSTPAPVTPPKSANNNPPGTVTWAGLGWGLGIATDFDVGGTRVVSATATPAPGGVVRVTDASSNVGISFVLEAHYFLYDMSLVPFRGWLEIEGPGRCGKNTYCTEMADGPFVAIEVGGGTSATPATNGPITAFAMGWMVGLHHPKLDAKGNLVADNNMSWNFGLGFRVDPKAQVLGDGLVANMPLPPGDSIRYKTEPRYGIMLLSSFSF
jgi:hypothetical protein